ncbi:MAG: DUF1579 family protein [Saprospiraceae bacterium]
MQAAPTPLHPAFANLVGSWKGSNKVYFGPDQPPVDTAEIVGEMKLVSGGRLLEFSYSSTFKGEPIDGKLLISYDEKFKEYLMTWIDSFHNSNRILHLTSGRAAELDSVSAFGEYPADETVFWGWRIEVLPQGENGLTITHFNVPPGVDGIPGVIWDLMRG